ncbi:MAG: hypothetical protein BalsKO_28400 [Balneolaceae bacterium]
MRIFFLFFLLVISLSNILIAQNSALIPLEKSNKYVYDYSYKYHGGSIGNGHSFTIEIVNDTLINSQRYYKASFNGVISLDYFPWIRNGATTYTEYLMVSDSTSFGVLTIDADTVFYYNTSENRTRYPVFTDTSNTMRVDGFHEGGLDTIIVLNKEVETRNFWIKGFDINRHDYNVFMVSSFFGFTEFQNILGFGTNTIKLIAAKVNGELFGDVNLVSNEPRSEIPLKVELSQNYPNPFNPSTTITIQVYSATEVELEVFDVMGRKVQTLYQGKLSSGTYNFQINGESLTSGVYYYRLIADRNTEVKSMILLK